MDGSLAIEENRQALRRIVATLNDMAGLGDEAAPEGDKLAHVSDSPLTASLRSAPLPLKGGEEGAPSSPPRSPLPRRSGEPAKRVGEGVDVTRDDPRQKGAPERQGRTIPRILWRAILLMLRPAESAARRLIIAASRGLVVPPPPPRPREPKPQTMEPLLRRFGIAIMVTPADRTAILSRKAGGPKNDHAKRGGGGAHHRLSFPLFDPPRRLSLYGQRRHTVPPHAAPRIFVPGITEPAPLPPPPSPDNLVSADHLTRRIAALAAALDDLPGQARRFARWRASRDAQYACDETTPRRISALRRGRPPGGRLARYDPGATHPRNIREVDEILAHTHALALYALESPDTS